MDTEYTSRVSDIFATDSYPKPSHSYKGKGGPHFDVYTLGCAQEEHRKHCGNTAIHLFTTTSQKRNYQARVLLRYPNISPRKQPPSQTEHLAAVEEESNQVLLTNTSSM